MKSVCFVLTCLLLASVASGEDSFGTDPAAGPGSPATAGEDAATVDDDDDEGEGHQLIQEVFQTDLVYPQEKGEVQLTVSPSRFEADGFDLFQLPFSVEYGITDAWQVELEMNSFQHRRPAGEAAARGVGDLEIGTSYSFMNIGGSDFHAAVGFGVRLPLGNVDKELSEGFVEYEPYLAVAKDFPGLGGSQLFGQAALGFVQRSKEPSDPEEREPAAHELSLNAGFFVPFGKLRYVTELNWTSNKWNNGGEEAETYLTPGLVFDMPGTWELSLGAPIGLNDGADRFRLTASLIFEFGGGDDE